jgi:fructose-bisphosphate aldolase class 1
MVGARGHLFKETLCQDTVNSTPFTDLLQKTVIVPGIKVDSGLESLVGSKKVEP